jgi:hypothetical protein
VFAKAIAMLNSVKDKFNPDLRYHGEAVCSRKHNVVQYDCVPAYYWILYDIQEEGTRKYLGVEEMETEAKRSVAER